ncbi:hypothetical protein CL647_06800, partial [bacterium]|nr:hypothetical protein [bacterium]
NKQLLEAAESGDISEVKNLLDRGADVDAKGRYGWTALYLATKYNHVKTVQLLLNSEADVNARNNNGSTALHRAVYENNVKIVQLLLDNRADVNARNKYGSTALFRATFRDVKIVKALVQAEADIEAKITSIEITALALACGENRDVLINAIEERNSEERNSEERNS